jgi:proteasome lid subunit RPN8/RPN11
MNAANNTHKNALRRLAPMSLLAAVSLCCNAADRPEECPRAEVDAHVLRQYQVHGPLSEVHEYFGFVYRHQGVIASAIVRSNECASDERCTLDTAKAARQIPAGAKVLGEWHTHPHRGSTGLSREDVRGANNNRHIRCYAAYYAKPDGEINAWSPQATSVPTAMASRTRVGSYREPLPLNESREKVLGGP